MSKAHKIVTDTWLVVAISTLVANLTFIAMRWLGWIP
jgi:hypothetical protein